VLGVGDGFFFESVVEGEVFEGRHNKIIILYHLYLPKTYSLPFSIKPVNFSVESMKGLECGDLDCWQVNNLVLFRVVLFIEE
jgi:hypothetical protein